MNNETYEYKPLSLMFVEYKSGDLLGFILAWITMLPILYAVSIFTIIIIRRDLTTILYFIGFLITELVNFVLKNLIKQPRPYLNEHRSKGNFSKYGMPSDHSQVMFYFSTFFVLMVAYRYYIYQSKLMQILIKSFLCVLAIFAAILVAFSRVYLKYHTNEQVIAGSLIGIFCGSIWFFFINTIFSKYFHYITTWKISEFLMIRDYTHIPNILLFQYTAERNEASIRRKNKNN
ncbi:dolichyldiphosphatase 1-like [Brachionus plicatilis]|uniref:Dolichyldiphosphatase 1 n=1 Tax=Brachionus plicatilis TaxID=10195 RepID=A0A3M7R366_BRAPC|nr:dolichyldiphosphatase 1-like [Brachionus plicatilis]